MPRTATYAPSTRHVSRLGERATRPSRAKAASTEPVRIVHTCMWCGKEKPGPADHKCKATKIVRARQAALMAGE